MTTVAEKDAQAVGKCLAELLNAEELAKSICALIAMYRKRQGGLHGWPAVADEMGNLQDMRAALVAAQRKMRAPPRSIYAPHSACRGPWGDVVAAFDAVVAPVLAEIDEAEQVLQKHRPGRGNQGPDYNLDMVCAGIVRRLRAGGDRKHTARAFDIAMSCGLWGANGATIGTFRRAVARGEKWLNGPPLPGSLDSVMAAL